METTTNNYLDSYMNVTAQPGGIMTDAGTFIPHDPGIMVATSGAPPADYCPTWVPPWLCVIANNPITRPIADNSGNAAVDAKKQSVAVIQRALPDVRGGVILGGFVLLAVIIVAIGLWSIVKD